MSEESGGEETPSYYLAEGIAGTGEAPDYFKADKYKTIADQAKAYTEAEKRISEMGEKIKHFPGAPDQYEVKLPEGVTMDTEDPMFAHAQDWARGINLGQEGFESLVGLYAEMEAAKQKAFEDQFEVEKSSIDNFDSRVSNINSYLKANELESLADAITTKDQLEQFEKLLDLAGKASISGEGDQSGIPTQEEIDKLMFEKDEYGRTIYGRDPERTKKVQSMLARRVGKGMNEQQFG